MLDTLVIKESFLIILRKIEGGELKLFLQETVREIDRKAEEIYGISSLILMENAGRGAAEEIERHFPQKNLSIVIVAGKGNNGGDGFVIARQLEILGYKNIRVLCLADFEDYRGDARVNLEVLLKCGFQVLRPRNRVELRKEIQSADLIVDAIFGTGLNSNVEGFFREAIEEINASRAFKCSVDIPSGIRSDTGEVMGEAVRAQLTVTFAVLKPGLFSYPGRKFAGKVVLRHIGIPGKLIDEYETNYFLIDEEEVRKRLKHREPDIHKGNAGHLLAVGGSRGKCGAVILLGEGALRSGAGLVTAMLPASEQPAVDAFLAEMMTVAVGEEGDFISYSHFKNLFPSVLEGKTAIAAGPGLGVGENQFKIVRDIIESGLPVVLDADALNSIKDFPEVLKKNSRMVITPHPGEFSRLCGLSVKEIQRDRINSALKFSQKFGVVVVLKGAGTVVASPEGKTFINSTGNHGMATGGMGDVLCGMIGSFLAQGYSPLDAAILGTFFHGLSADILAGNPPVHGYTAGDVARGIGDAFRKIYGKNILP